MPVAGGGATRFGRVIRSDAVDGLTAAGWEALVAYGIRTVVDLRNDDELGDDRAPRPSVIATVHVPLDGSDDREFWDVWGTGPQFGTPLYWRPHLERMPERSAAALEAMARADPGGVLFHCAGGRDRSGQIAMLLLALAGVAAEDIAADHGLSTERLRGRYAARGEADQGVEIEAFLSERGTSAARVITETLAGLDVEAVLLDAGLTPADLHALRRRLLEP